MSNVLEAEVSARSEVTDRRRPGRPEHVSPALIPLLRGDAAPVADEPLQFGDPDQLGGARGLAVGVVVSAALWAGLVLVSRMVF